MTNATHYVQRQRGCLSGEDTSSCAGITEETSLCSLALKLGDMAQHVPMSQCLPCAPGRAQASKPPARNVPMALAWAGSFACTSPVRVGTGQSRAQDSWLYASDDPGLELDFMSWTCFIC